MKRRPVALMAILLLASVTTGCERESISEPWLTEYQAETLEQERNRSDEQKQVLRQRLRQYGGAE